ncbi:hypothetical protein IFZ84_001368 [Listeria monocytogenes]|nr:hypothetical protein [Listeria monocytogenes]EHC6213522.1 hypothetical protein [Listeria monocytogenes serotype 4b]EED2084570.1 hypothetical protein [Listeria monocytogenes]EED2128949.1 hypothetical protein [Listeria monocytogenes]EED2467348.1 hypothetical protein [Listeria monocytogenes]
MRVKKCKSFIKHAVTIWKTFSCFRYHAG